MLLPLILALALQDAPLRVLPQELFERGQDVASEPAPVDPRDTIQVYDVRDLTGQDQLDALAKDIVSSAVSTETRIILLERYRELLEGGSVKSAQQDLVDSVKELIQPPLQGPSQKVQFVGDGSLTLVGGPEQHAWMASFLQEVRRFSGYIDIAAKILVLPRGELERLTGGRTGIVMPQAEADALLARALGADVLSTPRVSVLPTQRAMLSVINQVAYVQDFELMLLPDRSEEIADPIIDVLETGLMLDLRAAPVGGGRLALRAELTLKDAEQPFPEKQVRLGARGLQMTVQQPEVRTVKATGRFDLAPGSAVVMGGVDPGGVSRGVLGDGDGQDAASPRRAGDILVVLQVGRIAATVEPPR